MVCSQSNCGKRFAAPLELYNGVLTCPHCKKPLVVVKNFGITKENEELYCLSEICYLRYLSPDSCKQKEAIALSPQELLQSAIAYCTRAAKLGHPKAVYRMGYYNEFHMETQRSETERIKQAFDYYKTIWECQMSDIPAEKGQSSLSAEEFTLLKRLAASRTLALYEKHPGALKGAEKYKRSANISRLSAICGQPAPTEARNDGRSASQARDRYVYRVLCSCFDSERAPLFGMFKMKGAELKALLDIKKDGKKGNPYDVVTLLNRGLHAYCIRCDAKGNFPKERGADKFEQFRDNQVRNSEILEEVGNEDNVYFYFFNAHAKHPYLSASQVKAVYKELEESDHDEICELHDVISGEEFLFFCDDIAQHKLGNRVQGSMSRLREWMTEGD